MSCTLYLLCFGVISIQESKHWIHEIGLSLNMLFKEENYCIVKKNKTMFEIFSYKWLKKTRLWETDLVLYLLLARITDTFCVWMSVVKIKRNNSEMSQGSNS